MLVYTQYRNDFHNNSKRRKKQTQCTLYMLQKYHKTTHVRCCGSYLHYTGPTYMPNQRINMAQTETHSKILPSHTYMEITKNSIGLNLFKVPNVCQREDA